MIPTRDAPPPTSGGGAVVPHTVGLVPLSEDGIDRLTRALWDVEQHVHPPELVWWLDADRGSIERGTVWGYRGLNGRREALVTAWARDDDGEHLDLVLWVPEQRTGPRNE